MGCYKRNIRIGTVSFSSMSDDETLNVIAQTISEGSMISIAHANQHFIVEASKNEEFRRALETYTYVQPDGIGVYLAAKFLSPHATFPARQTGTDFYYRLLSFAHDRHWSIYFLGDMPSTLQSLKDKIRIMYPGIIFAGCHHGYFNALDADIIQDIIHAKPAILMVGMGVPKQELWVAHHRESSDIPVILSVGAGLRFLAGAARAPYGFRILGLEWLYRLMKEPVRLWRRYVLGIPYFCYLVCKQKMGEDA